MPNQKYYLETLDDMGVDPQRIENCDGDYKGLLARVLNECSEEGMEGATAECMMEFGPHAGHAECQQILANMSPDYPDDRDYSGWYGGEQGYQDGLRWSDFI